MTDRDRLAALLHEAHIGCEWEVYPDGSAAWTCPGVERHAVDANAMALAADRLIAAGVTLAPAPSPDALRAALEPFREEAETWARITRETPAIREDAPLRDGRTVGDWVRLAAALAATTPPAPEGERP